VSPLALSFGFLPSLQQVDGFVKLYSCCTAVNTLALAWGALSLLQERRGNAAQRHPGLIYNYALQLTDNDPVSIGGTPALVARRTSGFAGSLFSVCITDRRCMHSTY
jgi:hypothetical protein